LLTDGVFSIVEYRSLADANRAIRDLNKSTLDGRTIFVKEVIIIRSLNVNRMRIPILQEDRDKEVQRDTREAGVGLVPFQ